LEASKSEPERKQGGQQQQAGGGEHVQVIERALSVSAGSGSTFEVAEGSHC
jgi:hypothetical protein